MERKPSMYIGKQPFYINFVGVEKKTHEVKTPETINTDKTNIRNRTAEFAKALGFVKKQKQPIV